jgi:hypothetical protein
LRSGSPEKVRRDALSRTVGLRDRIPTHVVALAAARDVDREVVKWLELAYQGAAR